MRLVYAFLRFVYELQPRWWVMENVPRVLDFLPDEVPLRKLGIDKRGTLLIPQRKVLMSADFGVAQMRKRAFSGDFPPPQPTHGSEAGQPWRTLRDVVDGLPSPLERSEQPVRDPLYGFELPASMLTDHFSEDLVLSREEARENRKAKEDHSWYGRMSFPDDLDRPARTVMATNLRVSRETTVIRAGRGRYRRLSVREASSVQGFPITYQWWGSTPSMKYKLIGNAVAPPVAFALARSMLGVSELRVPAQPHVIQSVGIPAPAAKERRQKRKLPITRRFREHVPGSKVPGFRVDLDNQGTQKRDHLVEWRAVLYRGGGKNVEHREVALREAIGLLEASAEGPAGSRFLRDVQRELRPIPDASTLQRIRAEHETGEVTPFVVLDRIGALVRRHFGEDHHTERLNGHLPPRIAATLVATAYACAVANGRSHELKA
jgi:DNA (cytosine-5)-methyltransferase 1